LFWGTDGEEIPSYRGDNVNGYEKHLRQPDPNRIVEGYFHSAATINYARVVIAEGLGDLRKADAWSMEFVQNAKRRTVYENISKKIVNAMEFIETCGVALDSALKSIDMFTSHEGLHLDYEESMTTQAPDGKYYNTGAHFLWIGDRTRQLDHAHIEYFRGISNPIGIKVGPSSKPDELIKLIRTLWPDPVASPGRITLISRFGANNVQAMLPPLLKAVQEADPPLPVVWISDPMHGNTTTTSDGLKTRSFDDVLKEVAECINVHSKMGSFLAGVHFELTGDNVTECTGGPENLTDKDLPLRYTTLCDPRLNYAQSIEVAFRLAEHIVETTTARQGKKTLMLPPMSNLQGPSPVVGGKRGSESDTDTDAKRRK
jgi:3-deoxy-7-phosphoheptulonate synthase